MPEPRGSDLSARWLYALPSIGLPNCRRRLDNAVPHLGLRPRGGVHVGPAARPTFRPAVCRRIFRRYQLRRQIGRTACRGRVAVFKLAQFTARRTDAFGIPRPIQGGAVDCSRPVALDPGGLVAGRIVSLPASVGLVAPIPFMRNMYGGLCAGSGPTLAPRTSGIAALFIGFGGGPPSTPDFLWHFFGCSAFGRFSRAAYRSRLTVLPCVLNVGRIRAGPAWYFAVRFPVDRKRGVS